MISYLNTTYHAEPTFILITLEPRQMTLRMKTNRSYLVVSGNDEEEMAEARVSAADAVFIDLEDSIPPQEKAETLTQVVEAIDDRWTDDEQYLTVRVNGLDTKWGVDDITTLAGAETPPDSIVVPKIGSADEIHIVADTIREAAETSPTRIIANLETATACLNAGAIANAPLVEAVIFGSVDFRRSMGIPTTFSKAHETSEQAKLQKYLPRYMASMAASSAGIAAIGGGYYFVDDLDGARADAEAIRSLGFDGKAASVPSQVEIINEVFTPDAEAVEEAKRVVEAFEAAGPDTYKVEIDSVTIEGSHYASQKAVLERARAAGVDVDRM